MKIIIGSIILLTVIIAILLNIILIIDTIKNDKSSKKDKIINIFIMGILIMLNIYSLIVIILEFKNYDDRFLYTWNNIFI